MTRREPVELTLALYWELAASALGSNAEPRST